MKAVSNKIIIKINLGPDFNSIIEAEMADELMIAGKKWGIRLNTEDKDLILKHSMKQLQRKVSEAAKINWNLSDTLEVKVSASKGASDISLPDPMLENSRVRLVKSRDGWELEQEFSDESVRIGEFVEHFKAKIKTWARSAVFYGVSSYAQ